MVASLAIDRSRSCVACVSCPVSGSLAAVFADAAARLGELRCGIAYRSVDARAGFDQLAQATDRGRRQDEAAGSASPSRSIR